MKVGAMLSASALRYPERLAIVCGERRVTYRELEERTNRLANALLAQGLERGDRVALYLPNSAELVEAMGAMLKTAGVIGIWPASG